VLIIPFDENRYTELNVFWTLTFDRVERPETLNAPEILTVSAESVFTTPLEENRVTELSVFVTLTFVRVDRADTLKVATDKVVTVPSVEMILDVPSVF
jgi:hypothetical protein